MADITMTLDEYEALRRLISSERESEGTEEARRRVRVGREMLDAPKKKSRRRTKNDRIMSRALSEANSKAKKKNGDFRSGWDQSKLMTHAHMLRRRYSK